MKEETSEPQTKIAGPPPNSLKIRKTLRINHNIYIYIRNISLLSQIYNTITL